MVMMMWWYGDDNGDSSSGGGVFIYLRVHAHVNGYVCVCAHVRDHAHVLRCVCGMGEYLLQTFSSLRKFLAGILNRRAIN